MDNFRERLEFLPRINFCRHKNFAGHQLAVISAEKTSLRRSNPAQKCYIALLRPALKNRYLHSEFLNAETAGFEPAGAIKPHLFSKEAH